MSTLLTRGRGRWLLAGLALVLLYACADGLLVSPRQQSPTGLLVSYQLAAQTSDASGPGIAFDQVDVVHVRLARGAVVVLDSLVAFTPAGEVRLRLELPPVSESLTLTVLLRRGADVLFRGSSLVQVKANEAVEAVVAITPVPASIVLPDSLRLNALADTLQLVGAVLFATGDTVPDLPIAWSTLDPGVVEASSAGRLVTRSNGAARVVGSVADLSDTVLVSVQQVPVSMRVDPDRVTLIPDQTRQLTATVADSNGVAIANAQVAWSSDNAGVAEVDAAGTVRALSPGTAMIRASSGELSATAELIVETLNPTCSDAGTSHAGALTTSETWTRASGPHRVTAPVTISRASLTVEPGALVCSDAGAGLEFSTGGSLSAIGTSLEPIVFTAADPARGWQGLLFNTGSTLSDPSEITHAVIAHAGTSGRAAVHALSTAPVLLDSVTIRQAHTGALNVSFAPGTRLRHSTVDTTRNAGAADAAVEVSNGTTLDGVVVRGAAGHGVHAVDDGVVLRHLRVVGSGTFPLSATLGSLVGFTPEMQDGLRGNAFDTLLIKGGTLSGAGVEVRLGTEVMPWLIPFGSVTVSDGAVLRVDPGVQLVFSPGHALQVASGGRLVARGTADRPVVFGPRDVAQAWQGLVFAAAAADTSQLSHALIEHAGASGAAAVVAQNTPLLLDTVHIRQSGSAVSIENAHGTRLNLVTVDTTLTPSRPAVSVHSTSATLDGIRVRGAAGTGVLLNSADVVLDLCEIRESGSHAVQVTSATAAGPVINGCNFIDNSGFAIENTTGVPIEATNNWFGDAAGPDGPGGDGVSANVNFTPWLTTPVGAGATVPTALTVSYGIPSWTADAVVLDQVDGIRVRFARGNDAVLDTVVAFTAAGNVVLRTELPSARNTLAVGVELRRGADVLFRGIQLVEIWPYAARTAVVAVAPVPATLVLPDSFSVNTLQDTLHLAGSALLVTGDSIPDPQIVWSSADPAVAEVSPDGRLVGISNGVARVIGSLDALSDTIVVRVQQVVASVRVDSARVTLRPDETRQLTARAADANDVAMPDTDFAWSSDAASVAVVDSTGLVRAIGPGAALVRASVGELYAEVEVTVENAGAGVVCSSSGGTIHNGTISTAETWTRAGSPHRVSGTVNVGNAQLTVEAGALVCGEPAAGILFGSGARLVAPGTLTEPVVFTATDPAQGWNGLTFTTGAAATDTSHIRHAVIEHAGTNGQAAIYASNTARLTLDTVRIRQSVTRALYVDSAAGTWLRAVTVDTTLNANSPAVELRDSAVVDGLLVRAAAGLGVRAPDSGVVLRNLRVVGSGTYPLEAHIMTLAGFTPELQDSLRGNGRDTVLVTEGRLAGAGKEVHLTPESLPWRFRGSLFVTAGAVLRIEPGTRMVFDPAEYGLQAFLGGQIVAQGTAAQPIVFTASDPATGWSGIYLAVRASDTPPGPSRLSHAVIEYATYEYSPGGARAQGLFLVSDVEGAVLVDSVRIRQAGGNAFIVAGMAPKRIEALAVDTTLDARVTAVLISGPATIDGLTVRGAAGMGVAAADNATVLRNMRVVGSGTYPLATTIQQLVALTPEQQDSLRGNGRDTVLVAGGLIGAGEEIRLVPEQMASRISGSLDVVGGVLRVDPGVRLVFDAGKGLAFQGGGSLIAAGTAERPIVLTAADPAQGWRGLFFGLSASSSRLTHAVVEHAGAGADTLFRAAVFVNSAAPLLLDTVRIRQSITRALYVESVLLTRFTELTVDTTLDANMPAIELRSPTTLEDARIHGAAGIGVHVGLPEVVLDRCEITMSGGDGVQVTAAAETGPDINYCDLVDNAGLGINNTSSVSIDATNNWWGDAAGPNGPNGDGVSANVNFTPWLTSPVSSEPPAPRVTLTARFATAVPEIAQFRQLHVIILATDSVTVVRDTVVDVGAGTTEPELTLTVPVAGTSQSFIVHFDLLGASGGVLFRGRPIRVTLDHGTTTPITAIVDADYVGAGADAVEVEITTRDVRLVVGDSVVLNAVARDASGQVVNDAPIGWRSTDVSLATFPDPSSGKLVAGAMRGDVQVIAQLLTGRADTATVMVLPHADGLVGEALDSLEAALFIAINEVRPLDTTDDEYEDPDPFRLASLDRFSFEPARRLFQQAYSADPADDVAALGLAITTVLALEDHPQLRAIADAWDAWSATHEDVTDITKGAGDFPPLLAAHQQLLRDIVAPTLESALQILNTIDDRDLVVTVTPRMQGELPGNAGPRQWDFTDVLALRAGLETAVAGIDVLLAYEMVPSPYGPDGFDAALRAGSTFATLAADGAMRLAAARQRLLRATSLVEQAVDALVAESDDQSDDMVKYAPGAATGYENLNDFLGPDDVRTIREVRADVAAALQGPRTISPGIGLGEVLDVNTAVTVDLSRFFLAPIQDVKVLAPAYQTLAGEFRWNAFAFDEWLFPDPTLNGILPGMTSTADLKSVFDELEGMYNDARPRFDKWAVLAPGPGANEVYALSDRGDLQQLSSGLTSSVARPALNVVPEYPEAAGIVHLAPNVERGELVAVSWNGRLFTRPADAATGWIERITLPYYYSWAAAAESPAGGSMFVIGDGGVVYEVAADFSTVTERGYVPAYVTDMSVSRPSGRLIVLSYDGFIFTSDGIAPWVLRLQLPFNHFDDSEWTSWVSIAASPDDGDVWAISSAGELQEIDAGFAIASARPALPSSGVVALTIAPDTGNLIAITDDGRVFSRPQDTSSPWTLRFTLPRTPLP